MNRLLKRLLDIVCAALGLIFLLPSFIIIAVAIKIDSKGPVFFIQERRTKNGKIFKMYKFRSMIVDAEKSGTGLFNYENDPRVTKVGRFLRRTSMDELPQLFNVLIGDLSLVGPRPCVVYELGDFDTLNRKYKKRFSVRAGITGLAQVKGRNERRRKRNYAGAHFPPNPRLLEDFDPSELEAGISGSQIRQLKELTWLDTYGNIVLAGPPGLGKTMLAVGLGLEAINGGYTVCFERMTNLIVNAGLFLTESPVEN